MKREQCEDIILKKAKEIQKVVKRYEPNFDYLSISISSDCIAFNNDYWEEDHKMLDKFCMSIDEDEEYDN